MADYEYEELSGVYQEKPGIIGYVLDKRDDWKADYQSNYEKQHDEYYRLWRSQWSKEDQERSSERSRLISPALQQAVESSVAEVEEATFGRGLWFDLDDDLVDMEQEDIEFLKKKLMEDFSNSKVRKDISEVLINAAVTGTGIGEIVLEEYTVEAQMMAFGVETTERLRVRLRPVKPNNFLIEPTATSIEDAVGVIIDEFVPRHQVEYLQDTGVYNKCDIKSAVSDTSLEADKELTVHYNEDRVQLTKYYGLVPRELLPAEEGEEDDSPFRYVEAVVVIANNGELLKATRTPYMMKDRPIVAFPWDIVPSRFWGRGVCEKGYMSQKALDTEMRARVDALGLIVHPMMAMDASRMPRGFRPEIRPGKIILTQGPPGEVLSPFKFGNLDVNSFTQTQALQEMVQQATGAIDSTGLLSSVSGDTKAGAVSMSLGAVIKRHKRTLINFQDSFLIPFVTKAAWRYMQFDPENYPVKDYKFKATSTLGIIAREYEVSQLITLMQSMSPESPLYPQLIKSIIDNMNLSNREELLKVIEATGQPDPEAQQAQAELQELLKQEKVSQIEVYKSQAAESNARAKKYNIEAEMEPKRVEIEMTAAVTNGMDNNDGDAVEFDRRMQILDRQLKAKEINIKETEARVRAKQAEQAANSDAALMQRIGGGQ